MLQCEFILRSLYEKEYLFIYVEFVLKTTHHTWSPNFQSNAMNSKKRSVTENMSVFKKKH